MKKYGVYGANAVGVLIILFALSACGANDGNGDDSAASGSDTDAVDNADTGGGSTPAGGSNRIVRVSKDYDHNGTPEMITTVTYSDDARTMTAESIYTDDGTPDAFILGADDITYTLSTTTFTEAGLPLRVAIENTHADGSTGLISWDYSYSGSLLESITQVVVNPDTSISYVLEPEYSGSTITALGFDTGFVTGRYSFSYDDNGYLDTTVYAVDGAMIETVTHTWRSDGQLESIVKEQVNSNETSSLTTAYSQAGVMQSSTMVDTASPDFADSNYTTHYSYDASGKVVSLMFDPLTTGTNKASEHSQWEEGLCFKAYMPATAAVHLPNYAAGDSGVFPAGVFSRSFGCR